MSDDSHPPRAVAAAGIEVRAQLRHPRLSQVRVNRLQERPDETSR